MSQYPSSSSEPTQAPGPGYAAPGAPTRTANARTFSIIGAVFGVLALLFLPILFGPAGIALGFIGHAKGDRPFGTIVGIGSIVTMVLGFVIGAVVFTQMQN